MKYVLIIGDGMADDPLEQLGGKTPLEVCRKPFFDSLCEKAELGLVQTIPEGFPPGSDTAIMAYSAATRASISPGARRWSSRPRAASCPRAARPTAATW